MVDNQATAYQETDPDQLVPGTGPVEPDDTKKGGASFIKRLLFLIFILYILVSHYHAPILTGLGRYLVVANSPQESDLIVCLAGGNIERGLSAAEAYQQGLAPRIFIGREETPDGYDLLKERGVQYPESSDLLLMLLKGLGVPGSAVHISDRTVKSTMDEAASVRDFVMEEGYRSVLLITSPTHTRRTLLTFQHVFKEDDRRIIVLPSPYSEYNPEDWWKHRRYIREVIIEYQKLIYYTLKYFI